MARAPNPIRLEGIVTVIGSRSAGVKWLLVRYGDASAEDCIRRLAAETRMATNQLRPVDLDPLLRHRSILKIIERKLPSSEALLFPVPGGFNMHIEAGADVVRRRFSMAHEMGHTFFFNLDRRIPNRPYNYQGTDPEEERLCNSFAAEVLMPQEHFIVEAQAAGQGLVPLMRLCDTYLVSLRAAAIRLTSVSAWDVAIVAWRRYGFRDATGRYRERKVRVTWSASPPGVFIPTRDSVADTSLIARAWKQGGYQLGQEELRLGSLAGSYAVECLTTSNESDRGEDQTTIALIHLAHPAPPGLAEERANPLTSAS